MRPKVFALTASIARSSFVMASPQPVLRSVLRKQPTHAAENPPQPAAAAEGLPAERDGVFQTVDPGCLLDAATWTMKPLAVAEVLSGSNQEFTVLGVLGAQGLGRSQLLNRVLGFDEAVLPVAGPHPTPAFPVSRPGVLPPLQHCTRGVRLGVSPDRIICLDTQPLFSASVLEEMASSWEQQPPPALAGPAVAAAGDAKAPAVPFEGAQLLAELQLAVLLLAACHRVIVLCDGLDDVRTWELILTAEMLVRGVPDPTLPPKDAPPAGTAVAAAAAARPGGSSVSHHLQPLQQGAAPGVQQQQAAAARARQALGGAAEHLAEVVLVMVQPGPGSDDGCGGCSGPPSAEQLQHLEARLSAFFASSRLCRPGPLRMRDHFPGSAWSSGGAGGSEGIGYWVLPGDSGSSSSSSERGSGGCSVGAVEALVAALLSRPVPPFARRCSELAWLRGFAGDVWRAVRKSPDIAAFYSRLARTQLKGAAGWPLAR